MVDELAMLDYFEFDPDVTLEQEKALLVSAIEDNWNHPDIGVRDAFRQNAVETSQRYNAKMRVSNTDAVLAKVPEEYRFSVFGGLASFDTPEVFIDTRDMFFSYAGGETGKPYEGKMSDMGYHEAAHHNEPGFIVLGESIRCAKAVLGYDGFDGADIALFDRRIGEAVAPVRAVLEQPIVNETDKKRIAEGREPRVASGNMQMEPQGKMEDVEERDALMRAQMTPEEIAMIIPLPQGLEVLPAEQRVSLVKATFLRTFEKYTPSPEYNDDGVTPNIQEYGLAHKAPPSRSR